MTDAFIPNSNGAGCSNDSITTSDKNNITETLEYKPNSVQNDNNCNITTNFDPPQKGNLITVENSNITLNNTSNTPTNTTHDCDENSTSEECLNQLTQINEISKSDTVLKYVYQKDDKSFIKEKPKGHQLNSIQRRKRSINTSNQIENITAEASVKAPLIVNYETSHTPGDDSELPTHQRITENTIKNSALADFNIQTLHEPIKSSKNDDHKENSSSQSEEDDTESSEKLNYKKSNSYESSESDYLKNKQNLKKQDKTSESEESIEKEDDRTNKSGSSSVEDSREVNDVNRDAPQKRKGPFENYESNPQKPLDSTENSEYKKYRTRNTIRDRETLPITKHRNDNESNEEDSSKSLENSDSIESNESTSQDTDNEYSRKDRKHESQELIKKENFRDDESSQEQQSHEDSGRSKAYKNQDDSRQSNSYENNDNDDDNQRQTNKHIQNSEEDSNNSEINSSTPRTLQDVDLGDFSYERVQVDEKGKIVTAKDHDDNQSQIPIKPLVILDLDRNQFSEPLKKDENDINRGLYGVNNPIKLNDDEVKPVTPGLDQNQFSGSFKDKDDINHEIYDFNNPAKINDDEVKPVIEINSEHKENESDEDNSKEALKVNPDEDESLETILGVNKNDAEEQNEEIAKEKETVEKADVKQQFERIPLNYKHENEKDQSDKDVHADTKEIHQEKIDVPSPNDEGKKDTFSPKDVNYDDKLKFKFDDISIKLPEIKLPEDILSYAYEEPSYGKKKDKQQKSTPKPKYYQYSDENSDDGPHDDNDDNDHDYYGHSHDDKQHGTNEQQTKEADDHDHDYYGHRHAKPKQNLKKKGDDEEDDEYVDLYEKFVRERFGKRGSFEKRSEKLEDANLPYNPKLYENVQKILKKAALIDKQAKTSGDPKAGYAWTLEYGENLK